MNVRIMMAVVAGAVFWSGPGALAAEPRLEDMSSYWMRKKLEYSERILAGLAAADFEEIEQSARAMSVLTRVERWVHGNTPGYRAQLKEFQEANRRLERAAREDKLDESTQAFVQLTTSCVDCHKVVRAALRAEPRAEK